jgi:RNA polymerase sigma factor (sigma-70 family)
METDPVLEQRCDTAVRLLLERYGWQLLDRDEFIRRTVELIHADITTEPQRAAIAVYSMALYTACSGAEGSARRNLGYTELFHYLYNHAHRNAPTLCDDATQIAIEHVYATFERCRQPVAFLAFALLNLMNTIKTLRRQERGGAQSLDAPHGARDQPLGEHLVGREPDLPTQAITNEHRLALEQQAAAFRRDNPRAVQQLAALWLKHIDGLDDIAISQRLGVSVRSVYVLRSRALKKLRADPRWRILAVEFGILPDET